MTVKSLLIVLIVNNFFLLTFLGYCLWVYFRERINKLNCLKAEIETLIHQLNDEKVKKKDGTTYINWPSGEVRRGF